jgi:hypothetical protein
MVATGWARYSNDRPRLIDLQDAAPGGLEDPLVQERAEPLDVRADQPDLQEQPARNDQASSLT